MEIIISEVRSQSGGEKGEIDWLDFCWLAGCLGVIGAWVGRWVGVVGLVGKLGFKL